VTIAPKSGGPAEMLETALAEALGAKDPKNRPDRGRVCSVGRALTTLLALAVEQIRPTVHGLEALTNRLESAKPRTGTDALARAILAHKRRLAAVGQSLSGLRDGVAMLEENPPSGMGPHFARRLRDVDRHMSEALHMVEAERDQVSAILAYHLSAANNQVNEVIKTLTVLATVITPFTVISGIYGMNFAIPETHWRYGYAFALGLMALSTGFLLWFFRRHRWI
jgi:magnesium transporter